jgi:flagellar motor switch protein FliM
MSEDEATGGSDGKASAAPDGTVNPKISDAEVDALLEKTEADRQSSAPGIATPYDLVSPETIVRGRMPVLDRINERWTAQFQRKLTELIRRPVEAEIQPVQLGPFGEWQASNTGLTSFNLYAIKPWRRNAMVALDGSLLFALVDAYYGGGGVSGGAQRDELTPTEKRLNAIIVALLVEHFRAAFEPIAILNFEYVKTETDPHYAEIATSSETVVINRLDLRLGEVSGSLSLVLPLSTFDSVRDKLTEALKSASKEEQRRWFTALREQLNATELELATVFLETKITMKELLRLKPGDVLPIEMPKIATLFAGSKPLLSAKFGLSRGYNAVSIVGPSPQSRSGAGLGEQP